jgi:hypothetical protein
MIDLFEHLELLPIEVLSILEKYSELDENYENCANLVYELEEVGYTCEYYLDAEPYNLRNIEFDNWINDDNVIKFDNGYGTQDAQYNNRLDEIGLYKYFIKEFGSVKTIL